MRGRALALALLVLAAVLVGAVPATEPASAAPPGFVTVPTDQVAKSDQRVDPSNPPTAALPAKAKGGGSPSGVGDGNPPDLVLDKLPDHALKNVLASRHADTLSVDYAATDAGALALVLTDDVNAVGREVAIPTDAIEQATGRQPGLAFGVDESGERWRAPIDYRDGYAVLDVPHFSTQTVTFKGNVSVTATPASDGQQFTYDVNDLDATTAPETTITGNDNVIYDNESGAAVAGNSSNAISLAGDRIQGPGASGDPVLDVTLRAESTVGYGFEDQAADSGLPDGWEDAGSGAGPTFNVTTHRDRVGSQSFAGTHTNNNNNGEVRPSAQPYASTTTGNISLWMYTTNAGDGPDTSLRVYEGSTLTISIGVGGGGNLRYHDGTSWNTLESGLGDQWVHLDVEPDPSTNTFSVTWDNGTALSTSTGLSMANTMSSGYNETRIRHNDQTYFVDEFEVDRDTSPSVNVSDGNGNTLSLGTLSEDSTTSKEWSALSTSSTSLDFDADHFKSLDYTLKVQEVSETTDPSIQLNGDTASHTGTLADGTSTTLSLNESEIVQGTNYINVTVGDGTLSADAPTPQVDLDFSHGASADQSTTYTSEIFSSTWNVSYTYGSDRTDANVTIPVEPEVLSVRSVEKRVGGGEFATVQDSDYTLGGGELVVTIGTVSANETAEVRVTTSKVDVFNGSITVTSGTKGGESLNSDLSLDTWNSDSYIDVGGTENGDRVHVISNPSWSSPSNYVVFEGGSEQRLNFPNAGGGATVTLQTMNAKIVPDAGVDAKITVLETDASPRFKVEPGPNGGGGQTVTYTKTDATSGHLYILHSVSDGITRHQVEASSPVSLTDDDSAETLEIRDDGATGGGTGGDDGGGGAPAAEPAESKVPVTNLPAWSVPVALALLVLGYVAVTRGRFSEGTRRERASSVRGRALNALGRFGRSVFTNRIGRAMLAGLGILVAAQTGLLPTTALQPIAFLLVPVALFVVMRRTDNMNRRILVGVSAVAAVLAVESTSPGLLEAFVAPFAEQAGNAVLPLAAIAAYLVYRYIQAEEKPDTVNRLIFRGDDDG